MPRLAVVLALALLATAAHAQHAVAFPNPLAGGPLTVQHDADDATFELFDVLGRRLDARSELAAGVYLWRLRLADGTATPAQRLTTLARGPLDVHLVRTPMSVARAESAASASAAPGECPRAAPVFGGAQHRPQRGSTRVVGETMAVAETRGIAASETCLGAVKGVGMHFPEGASPYALGTTRFVAELRVARDDAGSEPAPIPVTLQTIRGTTADLRIGLDASSPRLVEVLDLDAQGNATVVASTVIPGGTPVSQRLARVAAAGGFELASLTASTSKVNGDTFLDSVASVRLDFRTDDPQGVAIRIGSQTVRGDAVVVTAPGDAWIVIQSVLLQTTAAAYEVGDLGFLSSGSATPTVLQAHAVLQAQAVPPATPAWLRTADPSGLYSTSSAGTDVAIGCARGQSCASYGVRAVSDFQSTGSASPTVLHLGAGLAPGAAAFRLGQARVTPDRRLLARTGQTFATTAAYTISPEGGAPVTGVARVTLATTNGRSLSVGYEDVGETATVASVEVRYLLGGVARRFSDLSPGQPVDLELRVEPTDGFITFGAETTTLIWRFADGLRETGEVEVRLTLAAPPASGLTYQEVTWTFSDPWTFGFASSGSGSPTVFTAGD